MPVIEIYTRLEGTTVTVQLALDGVEQQIPNPALQLYAGQVMAFLQDKSWAELKRLSTATQAQEPAPANPLYVPPPRRLRRHPG